MFFVRLETRPSPTISQENTPKTILTYLARGFGDNPSPHQGRGALDASLRLKGPWAAWRLSLTVLSTQLCVHLCVCVRFHYFWVVRISF